MLVLNFLYIAFMQYTIFKVLTFKFITCTYLYIKSAHKSIDAISPGSDYPIA
jgi:hypothetical protein